MPFSYWEQTIYRQHFDVLIIGAGLTGLNTALALRELNSSLSIAIVDKDVYPTGASTRNAGFACFGSPTELNADMQGMSEDEVWRLVEQRYLGLQKLLSKVDADAIDYQQHGGYEVFFENEEELYQSALERLDHYNQKLRDVTGHENVFRQADEKIEQFDFAGIRGMIYNPLEAQLHPGKLVAALRARAKEAGIQLLTGFEVAAIEQQENKKLVQSTSGLCLSASSVAVANNGYARKLLPQIDLSPGRGQVVLTSPIPNLPFKGTFHYDDGFFYFRNVGNRVLLGGGRNLSPEEETTTEKGLTDIIQTQLERHLQEHFLPGHDFTIDHRWSGIMGFGSAKTPLIEEVQPGVFTAVRLGGMGVALSAEVGEKVAGMVAEFLK